MPSMSDLPEDIMVGILSGLPAKSVGQCRCVSKPWRALLSQPNFIRAHLNRVKTIGKAESILIACYEGRYYFAGPLNSNAEVSATKLSFADHQLDFGHGWEIPEVCGYCDGLLLVIDAESNMLVLNPLTREIRTVPDWPNAFDLEKCTFQFGLGYDSASDDYKVVVIFYYDPDKCKCVPLTEEMFVHVYSLKTGTWNKAGSGCSSSDGYICGYSPGVFVNERIHWMVRDGIVAFDWAEENLCHVAPPPECGINDSKKLGIVVGCLSICDSFDLGIWVMKEYGVTETTWTEYRCNNTYLLRPLRFEVFFTQDRVIVEKCEDECPHMLYNFKRGTLTEIVIDDFDNADNIEATYLETLVSPYMAASDQTEGMES